MTEELKVAVDRKPNGAVLYTKGYINNVGGEEIAVRAYELMDADVLHNVRKRKRAEGRKKRALKLKTDKGFAKQVFEAKAKRAADKKSYYRCHRVNRYHRPASPQPPTA